MGKCSKSGMSQLRARAAARGLGVRHTDLKRNERALALRYISLGVSIKSAARAHKVLSQTIRNWQARAAAGASLADAPRSGRPSKIAQPETQRMLKIIHDPATGSLRKATAKLAATGGPAVAFSTIQRNLTNVQQVFRVPRRTPLLTPPHREARVAWSEQNADTDFRGIMFTDSKYFRCWPLRERARAWQHKSDPRPTAPQPKHGPVLHVYMGVTAYGATGLIAVTGARRKIQHMSIQNSSLRRTTAGCAPMNIRRSFCPCWQQQETSSFQASVDMRTAGSSSKTVQSSTPQQTASALSEHWYQVAPLSGGQPTARTSA